MHARIMSVHLCSMLGSVVKHHRIFVVFVSAQESAKLWLAYPVSAMAHDEQSLAAVAANSAVASRAWVHERLGRTDVQVSCVCPLVCRWLSSALRVRHVSIFISHHLDSVCR